MKFIRLTFKLSFDEDLNNDDDYDDCLLKNYDVTLKMSLVNSFSADILANFSNMVDDGRIHINIPFCMCDCDTHNAALKVCLSGVELSNIDINENVMNYSHRDNNQNDNDNNIYNRLYRSLPIIALSDTKIEIML